MTTNPLAAKYPEAFTSDDDENGAAPAADPSNPLAAKYGLVRPQQAAEDERGDFMRGAKVSMKEAAPLAKGFGGLLGATAEQAFGEGGASTAVKEWGLNGFEAGMKAIEPDRKESDELTSAWEQAKAGNPGALLDWGQYAVGYMFGQLGEAAVVSALGGMAGAAAGGTAAGPVGAVGGAAAGAAAGLTAKSGVKALARSYIEKQIAEEAAKIAAKKSAAKLSGEQVTKLATQRVAANMGKAVGSGAALTGLGAVQAGGGIYADAVEQAQKEGRELDGGDIARIWGATAASAGIEAITDKLGLDAITGKIRVPGAHGAAARAATGAAVGGLAQGGTEVVQTAIERVGADKSLTDDEAVKDYINSGAMGVAGGNAVGAVSGALYKEQAPKPTPEQQRLDAANRLENAPDVGSAIQAASDMATRPEDDLRAAMQGYANVRKLQESFDKMGDPDDPSMLAAVERTKRVREALDRNMEAVEKVNASPDDAAAQQALTEQLGEFGGRPLAPSRSALPTVDAEAMAAREAERNKRRAEAGMPPAATSLREERATDSYPAAPAPTQWVDSTPRSEREAQQQLAELRERAKEDFRLEGVELELHPHPEVRGAFGVRVKPPAQQSFTTTAMDDTKPEGFEVVPGKAGDNAARDPITSRMGVGGNDSNTAGMRRTQRVIDRQAELTAEANAATGERGRDNANAQAQAHREKTMHTRDDSTQRIYGDLKPMTLEQAQARLAEMQADPANGGHVLRVERHPTVKGVKRKPGARREPAFVVADRTRPGALEEKAGPQQPARTFDVAGAARENSLTGGPRFKQLRDAADAMKRRIEARGGVASREEAKFLHDLYPEKPASAFYDRIDESINDGPIEHPTEKEHNATRAAMGGSSLVFESGYRQVKDRPTLTEPNSSPLPRHPAIYGGEEDTRERPPVVTGDRIGGVKPFVPFPPTVAEREAEPPAPPAEKPKEQEKPAEAEKPAEQPTGERGEPASKEDFLAAMANDTGNEALKAAVASKSLSKAIAVLLKSNSPSVRRTAELARAISGVVTFRDWPTLAEQRQMRVRIPDGKGGTKLVTFDKVEGQIGGFYDRAQGADNIAIRPDTRKHGRGEERSEHVVAHEIVHALLSRVIRDPRTPEQREFVKELNELYAHVLSQASTHPELRSLDINDRYGLTNEHEFMSEALSNPRFQYALSRIAYQRVSAWSKFVSALAKMLGMQPNALTESLTIFEKLARKKAGTVSARANTRERGETTIDPALRKGGAPRSEHPAQTPLYEGFRQFARFDEAFRTPISRAADMETILAEMFVGARAGKFTADEGKLRPPKVERGQHANLDEDTGTAKAERAVIIRATNSAGVSVPFLTIFRADSATPYVEIGSDEFPKGLDGALAYQAAFAWAHNNGKTMRPDPRGLTVVNRLRRSEAMISSAYRYGTTRHLMPHPEQYVALLPAMQRGGAEPESFFDNYEATAALEALTAASWKAEDDGGNIAANIEGLLHASALLAGYREPGLARLEVKAGSLRLKDGAAPIPLESAAAGAEGGTVAFAGVSLRPGTTGVGSTTALRTALANSLGEAARAANAQPAAALGAEADGRVDNPDARAVAALRGVLGTLADAPPAELNEALYHVDLSKIDADALADDETTVEPQAQAQDFDAPQERDEPRAFTRDDLPADVRRAQTNLFGAKPATLRDHMRDLWDAREDDDARERARVWWKGVVSRFVQKVVDQFEPIKQLSPKAYLLARMSTAADGTLEAALLYGKPFVTDEGVADVKVDGDGGLVGLMSKLGGESELFLQWMAGQRAERLLKEGRENLATVGDVLALAKLSDGTMADGRSRAEVYAEVQREFMAYNAAVIDIGVKSGLLSQSLADHFKSEPYVPFYRDLTDNKGAPMSGSRLTGQKFSKRLKGGTVVLKADLMENVLHNWSHIMSAGAKNRAALATLDAAVQAGVAERTAPRAKGSVTVMRNGKPESYDVLDAPLAEALSSFEFVMPTWWKPIAGFKRLLTFGVTSLPGFKVKNLIRDSMQAIALAPLGKNPIANVTKGLETADFKGAIVNLAKTLKGDIPETFASQNQTYASMLASGGLIRFGTGMEGNRSGSVNRMVGRASKSVMLDESGAKKLLRHVYAVGAAYQELGDVSEQANRIALYEKLIAEGHSHGEASFMARDLLDFSMSGQSGFVRFLTQTVPFLNARMQGLYRLGRSMTGEQAQQFWGVVGAVSLVSLGLLLAFGDDEEFKKREDWERDAYWWFRIGDVAFQVPKPFEVGAFGTLAERTWELMFDKEMTERRYMQRLGHMLLQTFAFNPVPQAIKPMVDVYANKDSFSGRPIEGFDLQQLQQADRFTERTSMVARGLGALPVSPFSPAQVDYLLQGYFGSLAPLANGMADAVLRPLAGRGEAPTPDRLKFYTSNLAKELPADQSRYVTMLYERAEKVGQAYASYQRRVKMGDLKGAVEFKAEHGDLIAQRKTVEKAKRELSAKNRMIQVVEASTTLNGDAKRAALRKLRAERAAIAERANERLPAF